MNLFEANNIHKQYAGHKALDGVSIQVPEGSIYGLLGPNGAGKTTFIRIINQITAPDSGNITFNGEALQQKHIAQIGYLPEERGLYKKMKIGEQALYLAQLKGLSKKEAQAKLRLWFQKLEISSWWDKKVEELSKGMAQKVQFITTVLHEPKLLIFDEPFSGFDPVNAELIKKEILALKEQGATIIFSTHRMESVEELCAHIALINQGKCILQGRVDEVKSTYRSHTYQIQFEGELKAVNDFEIISQKENSAVFKAHKGKDSNHLLQQLLPQVKVISFQEQLPSINDIFIQKVSE
ncbi:MAG: ABC transporter ATP-binding protein [Flavobacteriales bacterium]|nr:ABC transporter ATP-binding protein [Flavobacteriales bacterium]